MNFIKFWSLGGALDKRFYGNQQKTQTQDKLGELTTRIEAVDYLKKEPRHLNANIPADFWFKDADQFIQAKKSM